MQSCGKADIGQIFRSIEENSRPYLTKSIGKSDAIPLSLATTAMDGGSAGFAGEANRSNP
jgi:hypothetical protein